jgi:RNA polymerase sigma-70 factor (sigma-E family)
MMLYTHMTAGAGEATIERARRDKLAEAYGMHASDAVRLAYLLTGDADLASDLVQDAFVRVAARWPRLIEPQKFRSYLRKTVANLAKNHYRRRTLERRHLAEMAQAGSQVVHEHEARDEVFDALLRLPLRQRTAIVLRFYVDLSERETADDMSCSVAAVKSLTVRGIKQLRAWDEEATR